MRMFCPVASSSIVTSATAPGTPIRFARRAIVSRMRLRQISQRVAPLSLGLGNCKIAPITSFYRPSSQNRTPPGDHYGRTSWARPLLFLFRRLHISRNMPVANVIGELFRVVNTAVVCGLGKHHITIYARRGGPRQRQPAVVGGGARTFVPGNNGPAARVNGILAPKAANGVWTGRV